MRIAIIGLNPGGTAIYAQYLAKDGHEVTILTESQSDVIVTDLIPHASLNIINRESIKLFTREYLEDILGISILGVRLSSVMINEGKVLVVDSVNEHGIRGGRYDRIVVGSEMLPRDSGDCISIYRATLFPGHYVINGNDAGKNTESLLLITDLGGSAITGSSMAIDDDVLKSLPINGSAETGGGAIH